MQHDLVIQGKAASRSIADSLALRVQARAVESLHATAYRLIDVASLDDVAAFCTKVQLDHALVPASRRLAEFRLLAMDMDSTLITIECIDELADFAGKKDEVAAITRAAMRGELDYPQSLRQRLAVLAGVSEQALTRVYEERLRLSPGAEAMLAACRTHAIKTLLVSGGFTFFTERLRERLGLDFTHSNQLEIVDGLLTGRVLNAIVDGASKAAALTGHMVALGIESSQVIAIGDGANDLPMMAQAGVSIAYHAKPAVRERASYCFNYVGLDGLLNLFR